VQRDPAKEGVNWYAYVQGNPTMGVDPDGEWFRHSRSHGPGAGAGPGYRGPGYRFYRPCPRIKDKPCAAYECRRGKGTTKRKENFPVGQDCCDKLFRECLKEAENHEEVLACRASRLCCYRMAESGEALRWLKACFKD